MFLLLASLLAITWKPLQPGVELATITTAPGHVLYVVRVDPERATLAVALASERGQPRTAAQWARDEKLSVAINAGMFADDQRSNVGYLRHGAHLNNGRFNDYRALLAANPSDATLPRMLWLDLDDAKHRPDLTKYDIVVQNLRLIAARKNVWAANERRWSEAALARDGRGRLLFIFSRAPYSMRDFNQMLLALPLDITGAMHLEGGPEASLSIHAGGVDLDLGGSFESGFNENDAIRVQWPIPNVIGVTSSSTPRPPHRP